MNLLPKSHKEFSEKDYWNKFFKKRGNKAFEWYGEYLELCPYLHKYIKLKDNILIPGCGNSKLSADLYDLGYQNITNIDVSEVVIRQMKTANAHRSNMKFICMDAMAMTFDNDQFNIVLDKGTLDALMPDNEEETQAAIDKYFSEIKRVLKFGGRFVCISLLQSHILKKLLDSFCDKSWMFRVVRCHEAEEKNAENGDGMTLPVFVVIVAKFKEMPQQILEICLAGDKMLRLNTIEELLSQVKSVQDVAFITNGLARTNLEEDGEVTLDLMQPGENTPRYTLYIVDQTGLHAINKYAVFIVPQGRESEWLFGTPTGRRQLQDSAKFGRLVVAVLRRGHHFESLDAVKAELAHSAKMLIPNGFSGTWVTNAGTQHAVIMAAYLRPKVVAIQTGLGPYHVARLGCFVAFYDKPTPATEIPFLSLGNDVGRRVKVYEGNSKISGDFVVEDVDVEGATHRRLVFLDNQFLVQSEAKFNSAEWNNKPRRVLDFGHISLYHSFVCVGVELARSKVTRVAVLGLGGGGLCMFLRKCYDDVKITAVDIDPAIVQVAQDYFELKLDDHLQVQIKDGLDFLREEAKAGNKYEVVMFDMDNKVKTIGLSCPPKQFLKSEVLEDVKKILTEDGQFIINLVCRDTELHDSIIDTLRKHFKRLVTIKIYEEVNEIVFAKNSSKAYNRDMLEEAAKNLNQAARNKNLVPTKCVDLRDFLQSVQIVS